MSCAGRQDHYVSRADIQLMPIRSSQDKLCLPTRKAEDLVRSGVVMMKVVYSVSPLRGPAMLSKSCFEQGGSIRFCHRQDRSIEENRQAFVVGHPAVAGKTKGLWFRILSRFSGKLRGLC